MEFNETRNSVVTDILLNIRKSAEFDGKAEFSAAITPVFNVT